MARPSKIDQAKKLLTERIKGKEITFDEFNDLLIAVTNELKLSDAQVREITKLADLKDKEPDPKPQEESLDDTAQTSEHIRTNITEADFFALQDHYQKLEEAISRIAVLTGNGNHLAELGIERWVPGKKHMNKKFA